MSGFVVKRELEPWRSGQPTNAVGNLMAWSGGSPSSRMCRVSSYNLLWQRVNENLPLATLVTHSSCHWFILLLVSTVKQSIKRPICFVSYASSCLGCHIIVSFKIIPWSSPSRHNSTHNSYGQFGVTWYQNLEALNRLCQHTRFFFFFQILRILQ
jgi:hypothetical protein